MKGKRGDLYAGLAAELVRELFAYDSETGRLTRKISNGPKWKIGSVAGGVGENGYRYVSVNKKMYLAHRLIWLHVYGEFPDSDIDHKNRNRDDNRIANLRLATRGQNNINSAKQKNNTSGFKGAYFDRRRNCWYAEIWVDNKKKFLGRFETATSAGAAYVEAAKRYFGEEFVGNA